MDYVPFLVFLLYLYMYLLCDKKVETFLNFEIFFKFSKNLTLCQTFEKSGFWTKFSKLRKISSLSKSSTHLNFIRNISILVQISKNLDFGQNFWKNLDWSPNFRYISILARKIAILVKIFENLDLGQNLRKISNLYKFSKNFYWCQTFENPDFGQNLRKIAILVKIFEILDFGKDFWNTSTLVKNLILDKSFEK